REAAKPTQRARLTRKVARDFDSNRLLALEPRTRNLQGAGEHYVKAAMTVARFCEQLPCGGAYDSAMRLQTGNLLRRELRKHLTPRRFGKTGHVPSVLLVTRVLQGRLDRIEQGTNPV